MRTTKPGLHAALSVGAAFALGIAHRQKRKTFSKNSIALYRAQ